MPKAIWNGTVLADSDRTLEVDGYSYFPPDSVRTEWLRPTEHHTTCSWKGGTASYWDIVVDGGVNPNAAWSYPRTAPIARNIEGWFAFWRGVKIE